MGHPSEPAGRTEGPAIPGYEVLGKVGEGGMGVVYRVRHVSLNRTEALKTLRLGGPGGPGLVARLRREAEVVARLSDPHVVQVYELGEQGGVPYLTMEFVDGVDLEAKLRGTPLAPAVAARLVETLARTVHGVHRDGKVLHRDLKPKNVLLAGPEEAPVEECVPKVTDFGLAKLLGSESGQTAGDAVVGTPAYMPPEQAQGGLSGGVDERADVYSLGAILYECLTGRPPFLGATRLETVLQVLELEPVPPGRLQPGLPRDLETVCLKCLEKSPRKRYASAAELAEDLRRFLAGEPIRARPVGRAEKLVRWARRRPAAALLLSALALAPLAAIAGLSEHSRRLRGALERAERGERTARAHLYAARVRLAWQAWQAGDAGRFEELMAQCLPGGDASAPEGPDLRGFEWYYLRGLSRPLRGETVLRAHAGEAYCVAYSADGSLLASGGQDGLVVLWDAHSGRRLRALPGHKGDVNRVAFSPDGEALASAGDDRTVRVWDLPGGKLRFVLPRHEERVLSAGFAEGGRLLVTAAREGRVRLWDARTGAPLGMLPGGRVTALALAPSGGVLAAARGDGRVCCYDLAARTPLWKSEARHDGGIDSLAYGPRGLRLASAGRDRTVRLWDARTGSARNVLWGHLDQVHGVAFAPDGQYLATASRDGTVRLWDAGGNPSGILRGHVERVWAVAFAPDGKALASVGKDGTVRLWDWRERLGERLGTLVRGLGTAGTRCLAFSPDGCRLATTCPRAAVRLVDPGTGKEVARFGSPEDAGWVRCLAFCPDGRHVAAGGREASVCVWDVEAGTCVARFGGAPGKVMSLAFSPDGSSLLTGEVDGVARLWDWRAGQQVAEYARHGKGIYDCAFSPDGALVLTGGADNLAILWDVGGGPRREVRGHRAVVRGTAFSPDGRTAVTAGNDRLIKLWDRRTGEERQTLAGHTAAVYCVSYAPDGRTLVSGDAEGTLKFWQAETGQELLTLRGQHPDAVVWAAFSPDGRTLATAGPRPGVKEGALFLWRAAGEGR